MFERNVAFMAVCGDTVSACECRGGDDESETKSSLSIRSSINSE